MSGVEVVGLVLGTIPFIIAVLDRYKGSTLLSRRKKHVDKLIHALLEQEVLLEANVKLLLQKIDTDEDPQTTDELLNVLRDPQVAQQVEEYLGPKAYVSYIRTITDCEKVVGEVAKSIEGLGPASSASSGDLLAIINAHTASQRLGLDIRKKVKLILQKEELDEKIRLLDRCTLMLERIQAAASTNHQMSAASPSKKTNKLSNALSRIQRHAGLLFDAIQTRWPPNCHASHEAKLFLNHGPVSLTSKDSNYKKALGGPPMVFSLIFTANSAQATSAWRETRIEILEDEDDDPTGHTGHNSNKNPTVTIVMPAAPLSKSQRTAVDNICLSIAQPNNQDHMLKLYLTSQRKLLCDGKSCGMNSSYRTVNTVSLGALLRPRNPATGSPHRLGWKERMFLALNISSNMLQLRDTPWFELLLSKEVIYFLEKPSHQPSATMVDMEHPVIAHKFQKMSTGHINGVSQEPRRALLELGILLLEIWHDTTLEIRFPQCALPTDYYGRLRLAWEWLDDVNNPPLPLYNGAIWQCVKCFSGDQFCQPRWDDAKFRQAICQDIVEPLLRCCEPWM